METSIEAIIDRIESSYAGLVRLYRSVPVTKVEEAALPNGWSVKDTLAHIAAWEWRCVSLLDASHHTDAPFEAQPDVDAMNHQFYEERKEWGWEEVENDFREAHQALHEAIRRLPAQRLKDSFIQESIAGETWEHYAEHLPELQEWHKRVASNR